ncbi:MAG: hypothetical protein JWN41_1420, partial [Thermoleophilia bacterium]|nr:hypothetical protein [Thermoleophilia bacterium]
PAHTLDHSRDSQTLGRPKDKTMPYIWDDPEAGAAWLADRKAWNEAHPYPKFDDIKDPVTRTAPKQTPAVPKQLPDAPKQIPAAPRHQHPTLV